LHVIIQHGSMKVWILLRKKFQSCFSFMTAWQYWLGIIKPKMSLVTPVTFQEYLKKKAEFFYQILHTDALIMDNFTSTVC